jgi:hypothetical protein
MLKELVNIFLNNKTNIGDGALFVYEVLLTDQTNKCIVFLEDNKITEDITTSGNFVNLELSLIRLNSIGYYEDIDAYLVKNKYRESQGLVYIKTINKFNDEDGDLFFLKYKTIIAFINAVKNVAKYCFQETDVEIALIFRDDKSLTVQFIYFSSDILNLSKNDISCMEIVTQTFIDTNSEKKLLFINELIDAHIGISEVHRFRTMLTNISDFADKCINSYQYYLRDFSYNKLKIELDSKVLEFTQKIQSVINDSQTKLVTIPTAFVLVVATFDFNEIYSIKNIVTIISLFIFAIIIQIFLNNQSLLSDKKSKLTYQIGKCVYFFRESCFS